MLNASVSEKECTSVNARVFISQREAFYIESSRFLGAAYTRLYQKRETVSYVLQQSDTMRCETRYRGTSLIRNRLTLGPYSRDYA